MTTLNDLAESSRFSLTEITTAFHRLKLFFSSEEETLDCLENLLAVTPPGFNLHQAVIGVCQCRQKGKIDREDRWQFAEAGLPK
jgi:hypothetical protein